MCCTIRTSNLIMMEMGTKNGDVSKCFYWFHCGPPETMIMTVFIAVVYNTEMKVFTKTPQ